MISSDDDFTVLSQQLNVHLVCPICDALMYEIEAELLGRVYHYYQCSVCHHQVYPQQERNCHCVHCTEQRQQQLKHAQQQEKYAKKAQSQPAHTELSALTLLQHVFLLSVLECHLTEEQTHTEYLHWHQLKHLLIAANPQFQRQLFDYFVKNGYFSLRSDSPMEDYDLNLNLDGYSDPSLVSISTVLRLSLYQHVNEQLPFYTADEIKKVLYLLIYQELVQYIQYVCRAWNVWIAGNRAFEALCYSMLDDLALSQLYFLLNKALNYLHSIDRLQPKNDQFVNTNLLKSTLQKYYHHLKTEKWETPSLSRPDDLPLCQMSYIFFYRFLNLDRDFHQQPIWKIWQRIEPRLNFLSQSHCMSCGSPHISIEYDQHHQISLVCRDCYRHDHYFITRS